MNAISQHPLSPPASAADRSSASKLRKFRELFDSCDPDRTEPSNPVITSPTLAVPSPEPKHMKYKELFDNADPDRSNSALPTPIHTLQVPDMSAEILRVACMRGDLSDIQERILHAATHSGQKTTADTATTTAINNDTVLRLLYACLRTIGVDFTPALAALESTQVHRCTRCSTSFRPADNTPTACAVPHAPPLVSWDLEVVADGVEPCETRYYTCCGRCVVVFPDQPEEDTHAGMGMCYVGPHEAPIHDVKPENVSRSESKVGGRGEYERDALAGKTHRQARPSPSPPSVLGQGHGHGHGPGPGTCVHWPVLGLGLRVEDGRSVPSASRTAAWVSHTAGQLAAAQPQQQQQQQHRQLLGRGRPPISRTASSMDPEWTREATTVPMIPWRQSSLYHPPGWLTIPPRLRGLPGDSPFA